MKKAFVQALSAGIIASAVIATVPVTKATAVVLERTTPVAACASTWSPAVTYVKGMIASHNGRNYAAKWWTQDENPATHSGQWEVWADYGVCRATPPTTPPSQPRSARE